MTNENDAGHVVTVVYDFQGRGLHSCLRCHYAGFSAPELPCPGPACRHCGDPIRDGERGVNWPWIHTHGFYACIGRQGVTKAEPRVLPPGSHSGGDGS